MQLARINIKNFRLLRDVSIDLAENQPTTVFVGPNNSGKTSVMDALKLFFKPKQRSSRKITIYDISQAEKSLFSSIQKYIENTNDNDACVEYMENLAPCVSVDLIFRYDGTNASDLMISTELLMNLDDQSNYVGLRAKLAMENALKLVNEFKGRRSPKETLLKFLTDRFLDYYSISFFKISEDGEEAEPLENDGVVTRLLQIDMIPAQRFMDDEESSGRAAKLSTLLHDHYNSYYKSENPKDHGSIEDTIATYADALTKKYEDTFKRLKTRLEKFGYPPPHTPPQMKIKAEMSVESIYRDSTHIYYENEHKNTSDKFELPEKYNGLGYKNLIYIVLQIESFCASIEARQVDRPHVHIIAIEEPEAHLHPQMQCVFIDEITKEFETPNGLQSQVILSTHSSHIVNNSGFEPIRYFKRHQTEVSVKDLSRLKSPADDNLRFLKRYIRLMHCNFFFADKAILVEGQVERLLLPAMINHGSDHGSLAHQYISILEVGGAHVHKFQELIDFIEIPTLVITDIDSIGSDGNKCRVDEGRITSNAALKNWMPAREELRALRKATARSKTKKLIRIAYQTTEGGNCGRSFEEAFIYANIKWLKNNCTKLTTTGRQIKKGVDLGLAHSAYNICETLPKVNFALDLLTVPGWRIPVYIAEGLKWLAAQESRGNEQNE